MAPTRLIARLLGAACLLLASSLGHAAAPELTREERAWIAEARPVVVGVQSDSPPYSFVDSKGRATGYSNEMFRAAARNIGLRYRFDQGRPWETLWPRAQAGQVDVLTFLWKTPERQQHLLFIDPPYVSHTVAFMVRADDPDPPRAGKGRGRVFVLGRDFAINPVLRARFPDAFFLEVDSVADALRLVAAGKADAYVDDRGTLNYISTELGISNLREGDAFDMPGTASSMAVRREADMLHRVLGKGLQTVSAQERSQLARKWLDPQIPTARRLAPYVAKVLPLLPIALVALLWLVYSHTRLAREVRLRRALESEALARSAELVEREAFQRELLDAAQAAVMVMDHAGRWVIFNRFAESLLGWKASDILGRTVREHAPSPDDPDAAPHLLHPEQVDRASSLLGERTGEAVPSDWRAIYRYAELGLPPQHVDLVHRDGRRIPVLLSLASVRGSDTRASGVIVVANDLGEQVRLEQELRASEARARDANEAKSAFLAAMSHEIRTPLIGITGMVEVLAHGDLDTEQRRAVEIIQASSRSLVQILGDILDFSKIEARRLELELQPANLAALTKLVADNFSGTASGKGIVLSVGVDPEVERVNHLVDALRLRQVISNLVSNAIKFTEEGAVDVQLERVGSEAAERDRIRFTVRDTGIGIDPQRQASLFTPFAQADHSTAGRFGGTGLGLAICRRLADLMGGSIDLESRVGEGTRVRFELEVARTDTPVQADITEPPQSDPRSRQSLPTLEEAEARGQLVLLVDDHPTNRIVVTRQLELAGYRAECAQNGEEALDRWRSGRYGLVLTDVHMPVMDGYELARAIRAQEGAAASTDSMRRHTPVIALTAAAIHGEAERCRAAGMDAYLTKPVSVPILARTLREWLPAQGNPDDGKTEEALVAAPDAPPTLDLGALRDVAGGDAIQLQLLLEDFLSSTRADLASLHIAAADNDPKAVVRQAHRISGAARIVGAADLSRIAEEIEASGGLQDGLDALLSAMDTAVARLENFIHEGARGSGD